jgi:hypothetical protein
MQTFPTSSRRLAAVLGAGALLGAAVPAAAHADRLETPAAGAANLAASGGFQAWSAPQADGTHRLTIRRPDGTVLVPDIPAFGAPVDPALGTSLGINPAGNDLAGRSFSAVYARCAGASATQGCDIFRYDIFRGVEERVDRLSTRTYSETAPSVSLGTWAVARRGGPRPGTYAYFSANGRLRRLTSTVALETAASPTRVAFTYRSSRGAGVQVRRASGEGGALVPVAGLSVVPRSVQVTRYRVGWLLPGADATRVFQTRRFAGSGGPFPLEVVEAPRTLPAGVTAAAGDASFLFRRYVDAEGVKTIEPSIR